ncbi:MAG: RluA family pseudouridine synthase [Lachnospiraceae bacterium]|jgi:23S rRNA pseudouridine1911/1915/1917 synthase|nr:RluA family pseudouridine synthase [Lachnospiraceae bacterium]
MERRISYGAEEGDEGLRIEQFLRRRGYSRGCLAHLKRQADGALVNGRARYLNERLSQGDVLTVHICETENSNQVVPVRLPLAIVYEDEDIVVVNKAAGMPTHPSVNNYDNSLANALAWYFKEQGKPFVFRCSNRLDRDTSGLTVVAKHMLSSCVLAGMTVRKEVEREYRAIVRGQVEPAAGTITAPLGRKPGSIIERQVDFDGGEEAVTHYQVVGEGNGHSLVALKLETGRTHQIRIHMKYLGSPLVGDYLYNPDMEWIGRQALHSFRLAFRHPVTGEQMEFEAPLPEDMRRVLGGKNNKGDYFYE